MLALVFLALPVIPYSALFLFWWAATVGQFDHVEVGAHEVFDADEPEAVIPDRGWFAILVAIAAVVFWLLERPRANAAQAR